MESPTSSSRRIKAFDMAANNTIPISSRKIEESEDRVMKTRSALFDITNDSPIVGLAIGNMKTPLSTFCKKRTIDESKQGRTPGSGEALLRDQVQILLQKVEEEAVYKKITFEPRDFVNSPMCFLAPTPANTPEFNNASESLTVSPVTSESFNFSQNLDQQEETEESSEKNVIAKLLFTDETIEGCYDSSLDEEDDDGSVWSVEVNASTSDELEDDEELEVDFEDM